jgi:hypothetical protein
MFISVEQLAKELNINRRLISRVFRKHNIFYERFTNERVLKKVLIQLQINLLHIMNERDVGVRLVMLRKSGFKSFQKEFNGWNSSEYYLEYLVRKINKNPQQKEAFNEKILYFFNSITRFLIDRYE